MTVAERSSFAIGRLHRPAFYAVVAGALGLYAVLMRDLLPLVATAWVVDTGTHRFHDLNFFALIWISIAGLTSQLYRPDTRVTAAISPVLVMAPLAVIAISTNSPIAMMPILFTVVGVVVLALHPAGRSLLDVRRVRQIDRVAAGLVVAAVVPLLFYAGDQLTKQYTVTDDHAALVHYGGMSLIAAFIVVMGALAVLRRRDWRFAAWSAGVLSIYLGASSVLLPGLSSSVGPLWGGLAALWGLAFIATVELGRDDGFVRVDSTIDIDAPIEFVWEVTTDLATFVEGIDWVYEAWWEDDGSPGEGGTYVERAKPGLKEGIYRWEVTAYEPPHRAVHYHEGGELEAELEVLLEAVDDETTRYTQIMHFRALPLFRPLGYVLERTVMKRRMQQDFDGMILPNFKRLTEERLEGREE